MRILYITDGGPGGVSSHVRCLTQCLKGVAEVMVCITYGSDALKKMLDEDGTPYHWCRCRNGHDWRLLMKVRRLIKEFRPEVIHFHDIPLFVALYVKMLKGVRVFCTLHTPSARKVAFSRNVLNHAVQPCYFLPVSSPTWEVFKSVYSNVKGEVFFNPIRIGNMEWVRREKGEWEVESRGERVKGERVDEKVGGERRVELGMRNGESNNRTIKQSNNFIVGMVGRNAEQKDWPAFCSVVRLFDCTVDEIGGEVSCEYWGVGVGEDEAREFGKGAELIDWKGVQPNGREWIGTLDLFVLTSKHEELPTTVLECFMMGTPICGFIPEGGMTDILKLSNGPLREVFVEERDCAKLAEIVRALWANVEKRRALVEDGRQILVNHFDADKNCRGRLMEIYLKHIDEAGK